MSRRAAAWWGFRALCRGALGVGRLLYGLEEQGREHLPERGPLLVVCRRISRVDFFGAAQLCAIYREFSTITSAMAVFDSPLVTALGRELGILAAVKGTGMSAGALRAAHRLLSQGAVVLIADEGEVPWDGRLQPLRAGAAWLGLRSGAPVVAAMIHGGYDVWPRWARWPRLRGKLAGRVGRPFRLADSPCPRVTRDMVAAANRRLVAELLALSAGYMAEPLETDGAVGVERISASSGGERRPARARAERA